MSTQNTKFPLDDLYNRTLTDITGIEDAQSARNRLGSRALRRTFLKGILPSSVLLGAGTGLALLGTHDNEPVATVAGAGAVLGGALWGYRTIRKGRSDYAAGAATANKMTPEEHKSFLNDLYSGKLPATPGNIGIADAILAARLQPKEQAQ